MKDYTVKFAKLKNGETLAYRQSGHEGPILLCIHGNQTSSVFFQNIMTQFEDKCRVYAIDLRGFGDSSYNNPITSLYDLSVDVALFMEKLKLKNAFILGWSTGGGVAMELAANNSQYVQKLILLDSVGLKGYTLYSYQNTFLPIFNKRIYSKKDVEEDPLIVAPMVNALKCQDRIFIKFVFDELIYNRKNPPEEDFKKYIEASLKQRNFVDIVTALVQFNISAESDGISEGSKNIFKVTCPIVLIHGDDDLIIDVNESKFTKDYLKEQATLTILANSGHDPMVDRPRKLYLLLYNSIFPALK